MLNSKEDDLVLDFNCCSEWTFHTGSLRMGRPSVINPYRAYRYTDNFQDFEFVCIKQITFYDSNNDYTIMYLNYHNDLNNHFMFTGETSGHQCGEIDNYIINIQHIRYINNKSKRIQNAIRLARLMIL